MGLHRTGRDATGPLGVDRRRPRFLRRVGPGLVAATLTAALTGCHWPVTGACTSMGGSSGVRVDVAWALLPPDSIPQGASAGADGAPIDTGLLVTLCIRDTCRNHGVPIIPGQQGKDQSWWFEFDPGSEPIPVQVSLWRPADGARVVGPTTVDVHPVTHDVNGGGCGPFIQVAAVRLDGTGAHEVAARWPGR